MPPLRAALIAVGDVITMDPGRPRVAAVAIADGRVVATGDRDEVAAAVPADTPVVELPGTVAPGFIDSHVHLLWGGRDLDRIDVSDVGSAAELVSRVRAWADAHPDVPWVAGTAGVDADTLAEGRFPTLEELDAATGGRPLFLDRRSHDALVNTAALEAAGIGDGTPDPPGGVVERDATGRPTGLLVERPAAELIERCLPPTTMDDRLRWIRAIQTRFLAAGITSVVDPALEAEELLAFRELADRGELLVRTTGMPLGDGEVEPEERAAAFRAAGVDLDDRDGDVFRIGPWKLFLDGGGSLGTALLREPWPGTDDYHGHLTTSPEGLRRYAVWAARTGAGLGVHTVGDAAIDLLLEAYGAADAVRPIAGLGFQLIHGYLWPTPEQMATARDLGVLIATQAPLQWSFGPSLVRRFGEEAVGRAHPLRSWLASGAVVGGGSDGPAGAGGPPVDPLWAFWQMQRRKIKGRDDAIGAAEALTAEQSLALYTTGAADVSLLADRGRLVPGAVGDLVALSVDPLVASPEACRDGRVLVTIVGGEIVHDAR
jgi:predicted amidohydrolase YtcJ